MRNRLPLLLKCWCLMLLFSIAFETDAQVRNTDGSILNPNDPIIEMANAPDRPQFGFIGKWARLKRYRWDTSPYKAYTYKNKAFRLAFPKGYTPGSEQKYPIVIMLNGQGENGGLDDNEKQLAHGAEKHLRAINNGNWPGFALFFQTNGGWPESDLNMIKELVEFMAKYNNVDLNRVHVHGLSQGGVATWRFYMTYPQFFASILPMSGSWSTTELQSLMNTIRFTPIWISQGGKDTNPSPGYQQQIVNTLQNGGAQLRYSFYPDLGHSVWNTHYDERDFWPWLRSHNRLNPKPLFERTEFCTVAEIDVTMGIVPGLGTYQWSRDGQIISGATSNTLRVTQPGSYAVRVQQNGVWSYWSPTPLVIQLKDATVTPPIQMMAGQSRAIPNPAGTFTFITLPEGYEQYSWRRGTENVGSTQTLQVTQAGDYTASVMERFGCSSNWTAPFTIINANTQSTLPAVSNFTATTQGKTAIELAFSHASTTVQYEVWRKSPEEDWSLVNLISTKNLLDQNLLSGVEYSYMIRPISTNAVGPLSAEVKTMTERDEIKPTVPNNLRQMVTYGDYIALQWDASTDDIGVHQYVIFRNNIKVATSTTTEVELYNLEVNKTHSFYVKAADKAGNHSAASNTVSIDVAESGLDYKEYHGSWSMLPDFSKLTPVKTGKVSTFNISARTRDDNFAFTFDGYIQLPVSGNWTFYTSSDDGSKLWIDDVLIVNNDGLHGTQERSGTRNLTAGQHKITVHFMEAGGGEVLEVRASGPGFPKMLIPAQVLKKEFAPTASKPTSPSNLRSTINDEGVTVSWNRSNGIVSDYLLLYKEGDNWLAYQAAPGTQTSMQVKDLEVGRNYEMKLMATGPGGNSNYSNIINVEVSAATVPTQVKAFRFSNSNFENNVDLSWVSPTTPEQIEIWRSGTKASGYTRIQTLTSGTTFTTTRPAQNQFYYYYLVTKKGTETKVSDTIMVASHTQTVNTVVTAPVGGGTSSTAPIMINFQSQYEPSAAAMWNQVVQPRNVNSAVDLVDNAGNSTGVKAMLMESWKGFSDIGTSGSIYEAQVAGTYLWESATALRRVQITGLDPTKKYTFKLYGNGSRSGQTTVYTINGVSQELETYNNLNQVSTFSTVTPSASGEVIVNVEKKSGSIYAYLNAMVIEVEGGEIEEPTPTPILTAPIAPSHVNATMNVDGKLYIDWKDNSENEQGFKVYIREESEFVLLTEVGHDVRNISIAPTYPIGSKTLYVEAFNSAGVASSAQFTLNVPMIPILNDGEEAEDRTFLVNFNRGYAVEIPWNNFSSAPNAGATLSNIVDAKGLDSDIALRLVDSWNGYSDNSGQSTGSNSGIFPDQVIQSYYWISSGTRSVEITGLNPNRFYKFEILGSRGYATAQNESKYQIGTKSVILNTTKNYSAVATLRNLQADATGKLTLQISIASGTYAYLNALRMTELVEAEKTNNSGSGDDNLPVSDAKSYSVLINFSIPGEFAPAPWNNTNNEPFIGNEYENLATVEGKNSGISMTIADNARHTSFSAVGTGGIVTGDNSGVYPDVVMKSYWWLEQTAPATLVFSGLDQSMQYEMVFFGSRNTSNRATEFRANGLKVVLDVSNNTTRTVKLVGLTPNTKGEIVLEVETAAGATLGYLGAMEIHATPRSNGLTYGRTKESKLAYTAESDPDHVREITADSNIDPYMEEGRMDIKPNQTFNFYPNPLQDNLVIELTKDQVAGLDHVTVKFRNLSGNELASRKMSAATYLEIAIPELRQGLYIIEVHTRQGVIRQKAYKN